VKPSTGIFLILIFSLLGCTTMGANGGHRFQTLEIKTAKNTAAELATRKELEKLIGQFDLRKYFFTGSVIVDEESTPHSHPEVTLHTRYLNKPDRLLAVLLHEQIHWIEDRKTPQFYAAMAELEKMYPNPPSGFPNGAHDKDSTYRHFLVNYLELQALRKYTGKEKADAVFKTPDVYKWIYEKVLEDEEEIEVIVKRYNLELERD
jgi:hypothetical protein